MPVKTGEESITKKRREFLQGSRLSCSDSTPFILFVSQNLVGVASKEYSCGTSRNIPFCFFPVLCFNSSWSCFVGAGTKDPETQAGGICHQLNNRQGAPPASAMFSQM